jgi:Peptidase M10 serralysin C terminal
VPPFAPRWPLHRQTTGLRSGDFSSIGGLVVGIAQNCVIENAVGGSGNDIIDGKLLGQQTNDFHLT